MENPPPDGRTSHGASIWTAGRFACWPTHCGCGCSVRCVSTARRPRTALAEKLGTNTGATSYHLRQLAEVGLVAEDPDRGTSRQRWWQAAHDMSHFDPTDFDDRPGRPRRRAVDPGRPGAAHG